MEVLLFVRLWELKSHNPAIEIYSHGRAARKRVNCQGQRGRLAPALVSERFVLGWWEIWTLQVSTADVGFRREREARDDNSTL